jgi:hypothetical protein
MGPKKGQGLRSAIVADERRLRDEAAQDNSNHRLGLCQQQLALLVVVLIAPFETGLIGFAWLLAVATKNQKTTAGAIKFARYIDSF